MQHLTEFGWESSGCGSFWRGLYLAEDTGEVVAESFVKKLSKVQYLSLKYENFWHKSNGCYWDCKSEI